MVKPRAPADCNAVKSLISRSDNATVTGAIHQAACPSMLASPQCFRDEALGQKRTSEHVCVMSALPPKADTGTPSRNVRFVPKADILDCWTATPEWAAAAIDSDAEPRSKYLMPPASPEPPRRSL